MIKNSNIYVIQRRIYGCPENSPREKSLPEYCRLEKCLRKIPPLGKSLIDINVEYRGKLYRKPCNF